MQVVAITGIKRSLNLVIVCAAIASGAAAQSPRTGGSAHRQAFERYCGTCHSERLKTAGFSVSQVNIENPSATAEGFEKVIGRLRTRTMPPAGAPRPDDATYQQLARYLETSIDAAAAARPNPGRPGLHRLNRAEYANAVRDVLGVNVDGNSLLPVDDSGYGFDNVAAVLSASPALLERYLIAARKISRLAMGDASIRPTTETYESKGLLQTERMDEQLPFGTRGGMSLTHDFPADGEYAIKILLLRDDGIGGYIRGVALKRELDVRLDGVRLGLFSIGGEAGRDSRAQEEYERGGADAHLEVRIPVKAGPHHIGVSFLLAQTSISEGIYRPPILGLNPPLRSGKDAEPWVDSVAISGPYNPKGLGDSPSRRRILTCQPPASAPEANSNACAEKLLTTLARRAYRRPATRAEVQDLMRFYAAGRKRGGFEDGIQSGIERMLVSVNFLFRTEPDPPNLPPGSIYRVPDLELASRLSFFLWSSVPDDQLLGLAERGKLADKGVLEAQVRRMLRDSRGEALINNFFGQWLQLRHVEGLTPDPVEFPAFDESLRQAFETETRMFLASIVKEDHPLTDLLGANYTFLNERLARHYGIPNVYGSSFRRVALTDDNRRGLLGQGSILALTSYATRTSIVLRGVWVLNNILGTPPPPPPPDVPLLKERGEDGKIRSVRESMEQHRVNPVCGNCHARMDPIGFALENFDGIGAWRTTEGSAKTPVDSSAELPDGTKFKGPTELRRILLAHPEQFSTIVTEKLLTYALGRGLEFYDQPTVRKIVRGAAANNYRWSSLIVGIVESEPFQKRRALPR